MDPIITLEVVIILPMLLVGMILINIQLLEHEQEIVSDVPQGNSVIVITFIFQ